MIPPVLHRRSIRLLLALFLGSVFCVAAQPAQVKPAVVKSIAKKPAVTKHSSQGFSYVVEQAPGWVDAVEFQPVKAYPNAAWQYVLRNSQVLVGSSIADHTSIVRRVNTAAGLTEAAKIAIVFEPSYQSLSIHQIEIRRGSQVIDRIDSKSITLLRRETRLEASTYDGYVTAAINLGDLRVGDYVVYRYTITGNNPSLEGRFSEIDEFYAQQPINVYRKRYRQTAERNLLLHYPPELHRTDKTLGNGDKETVLEAFDVMPSDLSPGVSPGAFLGKFVIASQFQDWADVAKWGTSLFNQKGAGPGQLVKDSAARLGSGLTDQRAKIEAVLTFVQNDVRYLSVSLGASSHRPAPPAKVLEQRFGDCKDKVALMVAMLKELGIESYPVLVSSFYRDEVSRHVPSHVAFDHAILGVDVDGKTLWLDPTRVEQAGPLEGRQAWSFGFGLPLKASTSQLAKAPDRPDGQFDSITVDTFEIAAVSQPAKLTSRISYFGEWAEGVDAAFKSAQSAELKRELFEFFPKVYPKLREQEPLRVEQGSVPGSIDITQSWSVPEAFEFIENRGLVSGAIPWTITSSLVGYQNLQSKSSIYFGPLMRKRHTVRYEFAEDMFRDARETSSKIEGKHFSFWLKFRIAPRSVHAEYEFRTHVTSVPASEFKELQEKVQEVITNGVGSISLGLIPLHKQAAFQADVEQLDKQLQRRSLKWVTGVQYRAHLEVMMMTRLMEGGRVTGQQRAGLLRKRAVAHDHLNQTDKALADIVEAVTLDPINKEIKLTKAEIHFGRGEYQAALDSIRPAGLANGEDQAGHFYSIGRALYYLGDFAGAAKNFEAAIRESDSRGKAFAWLWLAMAVNKSNAVGTDTRLAEAASGIRLEKWPLQLMQYFKGEIDDTAVLNAAKDKSDAVQRSQLCEAYFFIGQKQLQQGNAAAAIRAFEKAIDTEVHEYIEYRAAKTELSRLKQ